jgi:poly(3-hydroxybutyrate) depolymerase
MTRLHAGLALLLTATAGPAAAVQSVTLPGWVCAHPDAIWRGGFENGEAPLPHEPSNGSGGAYPGAISRTLHIVGLGTGTQTYYLYVPGDYTPARTWPLLMALHGVAPYGSADSYASTTRDTWTSVAALGHFIVAAPVADQVILDSSNQPWAVSWLIPPTAGPSDYDLFAAMRADLESAYNIERTRVYGWGFSAGGHVMHDLGINNYSSAFNASTMAAYSVSAGDLAGLACEGLSDTGCNQALDALPRKVPVDLHIGNNDPNVSYVQSDYARFLAQGWTDGASVFYNIFVGGHTYSVTDLQIAWANLCPNAVTP